MDSIKCVVLENRELVGYSSAKELLEIGGEELFVIDLDGLNSGAYNFKLYNEVSKFFEIVVMSFPRRAADLVDCIVAGAARVVVSGKLPERNIVDFLGITDELVMNYSDIRACRTFSSNGGMYYLSNRMVDFPFTRVYMYGNAVDAKGYTVLEGFPEFMYNEA